MPVAVGVCSISDSSGTIFLLPICACAPTLCGTKLRPAACWLYTGREGHAALFFPSQLRPAPRSGRGRGRVAEPVGGARGGARRRARAGQSRGRRQRKALGELVLAGGRRRGPILPYAGGLPRAGDRDRGWAGARR